jgi:ligand-binding sensor domain-containing protein
MPQVTLSTYRAAVLVAAALLAGCGAADTPTVGSLAPALTAERSATSSQRSLYVLYQGVNTLVEYSHDGTQVLRKITHGIHGPKSLAIDSQGAIYIGNSTDPKRGGVNVYLPGKLSPTTNIKTDGRPSLALDADGNVYVAAKRSVGVYGNYGKTLLRTINTTKYLYNIALDSSGNLYVGTGGGINVYQAGQTKLSRTIPLRYAFYLAVDRTDNLYAVAYDSAKEI